MFLTAINESLETEDSEPKCRSSMQGKSPTALKDRYGLTLLKGILKAPSQFTTISSDLQAYHPVVLVRFGPWLALVRMYLSPQCAHDLSQK